MLFRYAVEGDTTAQRYKNTVISDSGTVQNAKLVQDIVKYYKNSGRWGNIRLMVAPPAGVNIRDSSPYKYASKLYSFDRVPNNVAQGNGTLQPYFSGFIAPNERYAILNPNGGTKIMTHNAISFGAGVPWTISMMLNYNSSNEILAFVVKTANARGISLKPASTTNTLTIRQYTSGDYKVGTPGLLNKLVGKNSLLQISASGTNLSYCIDGVFQETITGVDTQADFQAILNYSTNFNYYGKLYFYSIEATALSAAQCLADFNFWRSYIPEIETVLIGSKYVASSNLDIVTTANGTAIADATLTVTWITGASGWCYHTSSVGLQGKIYNRAARNAIIANPPAGYHVATEAELTALAALGGNALKCTGSLFWSTANGTNSSGFTAMGGASRNADGTFNTFNESVKIWCADSDKALQLEHNNDNATLVSMTANEGAYIRLIKD